METMTTLILGTLTIGIYYYIKDNVVFREKVDGITGTYHKFSDIYNIGNSRTKFVTHYASGLKKVNYLSDAGKTVIVWLNRDGVKIRNYTCGFFREVYYLTVIFLWSEFGIVKITQSEQYERWIKSKAGKRKAAGSLEKEFSNN